MSPRPPTAEREALFEIETRGPTTKEAFKALAAGPDYWYTVTVDVPAEKGREKYTIFVRLGKVPEGRLVCTGLLIGAVGSEREITARSLRRIPLAQLLTFLARISGGGAPGTLRLRPFTRPGPTGLPREHFEDVAKGYREALINAPRAPIKFLAKLWGRPEVSVRRWVQRCRDMGLLGPSAPGKAGEVPPIEGGEEKR